MVGIMRKKIIKQNKDLLIFAIFSLFFAIIMEYLAYQQFLNSMRSLSFITSIGGAGFIFVSIYSLFKLNQLRNKHHKEIDMVNKYDTLTAIPNVYSFLKKTSNRIEILSKIKNKSNKSLFLINIGINRFGFINETFGYTYADKIIVLIKDSIESLLDEHDYLGRLNGDEFGILTTCDKKELLSLVKSLESIFSKEYKTHGNDGGVFINGRIGISNYNKEDKSDKTIKNISESIFKKANIALDFAKKEGCFYKMYDETLEREANKIMDMEKHLRLALKNNEIEVVFQPKISTKTGKVVGAEALARWYSRKLHAYISPDVFIAMAEDMGIIDSIGDFILKESAKELKKWHNIGYNDLKIAVNVSTYQFRKELPSEISDILLEFNISPSDFEIEVTESGIITDKRSGTNLLKVIQNSGITIAIDDFGTGYSSLAYLVEFPLDIIKIDKSFVDKINNKNQEINKKGRSVISSLVGLAHSIGCKVVAEGAEDIEQVDFLKLAGCDYIQGYYYSKPLKNEEFISYLKNKNGLNTP